MKTELFSQLYSLIKSSKSVAIISHVSPDGDTLASSYALKLFIDSLGVRADLFCEDKCPYSYFFLIDSTAYSTDDIDENKYDAFIAVDCADALRTGKYSVIFNKKNRTAVIDHHKTNVGYADINIIDETAAATGVIVFDFFQSVNHKMSREQAELIYAAISTDTGNFTYSNADRRAYNVAGICVESGIDVAGLTKCLFKDKSINKLNLIASAILTIKLHYDGKISSMTVSNDMLEKTGCTYDDTDELINYCRDIYGVKAAVLVRETAEVGVLKVSMRSNDVDVAAVALSHGGGGHTNAAGCNLKMPLLQGEELIVKELSELL
ncbi:MAG: bifunctional oligoribonuclease/PAP phosphatase NrnA [Clostridiales bacterium]|nr:bifunctional oligoribonuclease/PAP phosphatase NrnA [Clostridiales bacterium]